jgi:hypothetical protein
MFSMRKLNIQIEETDGASTIFLTKDTTLLLVGDTRGRIRVYDISRFKLQDRYNDDIEDVIPLLNVWKAHATCVLR